jgi:membrane associated rhomboid family serine protease
VIPSTKAIVQDTLIAGAFMTMGVLLPGALLDRGFEAHVGGIALGIGLGWLIKSTIDHVKGESYES